MYGIDTNILVYMFDAASIYQSEAKIFIVESLKKEKIAIAEFTLFEFYSVITDGRENLFSELSVSSNTPELEGKGGNTCNKGCGWLHEGVDEQ